MTLPDFKQERKLFQLDKKPIIALDEAGRGALAGPVIATAFFVPHNFKKRPRPPIPVKDSKQLSPKQRQILFNWLKNKKQFCFKTSSASPKTIDKINIRQANFLAMSRATKKLNKKRFIVFVDGKETIPKIKQKQFAFVRGDEKIFSLACASIIAKVVRDRIMIRLAKKYPRYGFEIHKGYGTKKHFKKIKKYGITPIHRKSFLKKLF
jgi:ribonuclease HII